MALDLGEDLIGGPPIAFPVATIAPDDGDDYEVVQLPEVKPNLSDEEDEEDDELGTEADDGEGTFEVSAAVS